MKKVLAISLALILSMALAGPVLADWTVDTAVEVVGEGGGGTPVIKCKWETPDDYVVSPGGTQIDPPLVWEAYKPIKFWAIVWDSTYGKEAIVDVHVDVYHPDGPPECGSHKYQVQMVKMEDADKLTVGIDAFTTAWDNGTISSECIGENPVTKQPYTRSEILTQLQECSCDIYVGERDLYYEQPAGDYKVVVKATNHLNEVTTLTNYMEYVATNAIELDFEALCFGQVNVCIDKQIDGDRIWADPPALAGNPPKNGATVRNIGNTLCQVTIHETDLYEIYDNNGNGILYEALGVTETPEGDVPNVEYDARLGDATMNDKVYFDPCETVTLPGILEMSTKEKLDFSIHIKKHGTTGIWLGTMTVGCVYVPFCELYSCPSD
jgi:hypothetical protein